MSALDDHRAWLVESLRAARQAGLERRLTLADGVDLVSNDYLGLAEHPQLIERMRAELGLSGAGSGGSRLLRGHRECFARIEERLAAFSGSEAALLFGSGYAANLGLLQSLLTRDDLVVSDAGNHASLIDGIRLSGARRIVYPHQDLDALSRALEAPRGGGRAFVVSESLFSMDGDLTPLRELCDVAERHGALVVVDEAHATGLYGGRGSGRVEELGLRERVLASVHTGGKALGSGGAWVAGSGVLRDWLVNRARTFIFSTAPLPVLSAALDAALDVVEREPERRAELQRKARLLREALGEPPLATASPIVPVIVGGNDTAVELQRRLAECGFDVRAVRPPTVPEGTARLRVTCRYPVPDHELLRFAAELGRLLPREEQREAALEAGRRSPA